MNFTELLEDELNYTTTENGAVALKSTKSGLLDAFGTLGAMRTNDEAEIIKTFNLAFAEDKELAMKLLFYIRDIRGGQGERRVFRVIMNYLAKNKPEVVIKNLDNFAFYGRYDDLLCLLDTPVERNVLGYINDTLKSDLISVNKGGAPSLMAKWLPSVNGVKNTRKVALKIVNGLNMSEREYRKTLSKLRKALDIVETKLCEKRYEDIDFSKLPSKAQMLYRELFMRHAEERYLEYLKQLSEGKAKINAGALLPVDIVGKVLRDYDVSLANRYLYDAMWKNLPNWFEGKEETGLCVVDVSGSMYGTPIEVAISLGLYCADKANGVFKNKFITFSEHPELVKVQGEDIVDKVINIENADWGYNTDFDKVLKLILDTAIKNNCPQSDLPNKLYVISDMQFDAANGTGNTLHRDWAKKFAEHGYEMPAIVYWNVATRKCGMFQEDKNGTNVAMVSGYSPVLFKNVIEGTEYVETVNEKGEKVVKQQIDPVTVMLTTLQNERYDRVVA
jgi:hypothetical protein